MIQLLKKIGTIMSLTGFGFKINEVINHTLRGQFFTYANLNIKNLYSLFVLAISIYKYFMFIKNIYTLDIMYIIIIMYDTILLFIY